MRSRLRKAYVAAKLLGVSDLIARARHSVATAACSSGFLGSNETIRLHRWCGNARIPLADERELIPTGPKARADGGGRTHTTLRSLDFESSASANSATSA